MSIKLKDTIFDYIDKANKDGSGNIISSTYLPLSGGTINGKIIFKDDSGIWNDHNDGVLGIHVKGWDGVNSYSAVFGSPSFPTILRSSENVKIYYGGHNYSLIHSGNISSQSVNYATSSGNADTLDGLHDTGFFRFKHIGSLTNKDLNYANNMYGTWNYGDDNTQLNTPTTYYGAYISFGDLAPSDTATTRNQTAQIGVDCWNDLGRVYVRARQAGSRNVSSISSWKTLAFTTDNVASSTKLATARTIWGQSFDGTGNVSGALSGVSGITFTSNGTTYGSYGNPTMGATAADWTVYSKDDVALLSVVPNGNVGIGQINPVQKLDVNGNILIPNWYALMSRKTDGTGINLIYCGNDDIIKIGGSLPIKLQGNTTVTGSISLSGDWENDFGINFNEGGGATYGFSLLYGASDKFKLTTRDNSTTNTEVFSVGRGSTTVTFASTPKVGTTKVSLEGHSHSNYSLTSHTHTKSQITDFPSSLPANGGNADTVDNKHASDFMPASGAYISGTTVADVKTNLLNYFNNKPATTSAYTSSTFVGNFGNDSYTIQSSSVCGWIALNPGYDNYNHGHFLVSEYGSNRLRHVGLGYSTWYGPYTIAYTSDIPTKVSQLTNDSGYLTSLPSHTHSYAASSSAGGAATSANKLNRIDNTVNSTSNDTTSSWGSLGTSVHFYAALGQLKDQPSQYGLILNVTGAPGAATEVHQLWMTQASGNLAHRGGNSSGWSGTWRTILDSSNWSSYCASSSHTHNYAGSSSSGGAANNSLKWGGYSIVVGSTGTDANTIYIIV